MDLEAPDDLIFEIKLFIQWSLNGAIELKCRADYHLLLYLHLYLILLPRGNRDILHHAVASIALSFLFFPQF